MNPYQVLGLDPQSSLQQIKETYRELSRTFHPDKQPHEHYDLSIAVFEEIDAAYKMICTNFHKCVYDNFGRGGIDMLLKYPSKFEYLIRMSEEGQDVLQRVRSKIIKLQLREQELLVYADTLKSMYLVTEFNRHNHKQFLSRVQMMQVLKLPNWYGFSSDFRTNISAAYNHQGRYNMGYGYGFKTSRMCDLRLLRLCQLKGEIAVFEKDVSGNISMSKQINSQLTAELNAHINKEGILPSGGIAFNDENQRSINISFHNDNPAFIVHIPSTMDYEVQLTPQNIQLEITRYLYRHKYYSSSIKVTTVTKPLGMLLQSHFKFRLSKLFAMELTGSPFTNTLEINIIRGNNKFSIPLILGQSTPTKILMLLVIPQVLPTIWRNPKFRPWNRRLQKRRMVHVDQLQEFVKQNDIVRNHIIEDEYYNKYRECEDISGLIIQLAYVGEKEDIEHHIVSGAVNQYMVNITQQLQCRVVESALCIPQRSFDKLAGFYRYDLRIPLTMYYGYVVYSYKQKTYRQKWRWVDPLEIGDLIQSNSISLNNYVIQWLLQ